MPIYRIKTTTHDAEHDYLEDDYRFHKNSAEAEARIREDYAEGYEKSPYHDEDFCYEEKAPGYRIVEVEYSPVATVEIGGLGRIDLNDLMDEIEERVKMGSFPEPDPQRDPLVRIFQRWFPPSQLPSSE